MQHKPVLLAEVLTALAITDGQTFIDCTFGAGGYTKAILESANTKVIAFDRDPSVRPFADSIKDTYGARFTFINADFTTIEREIQALGNPQVHGIVYDFGVSSMQIDTAERGFSFYKDGPLDMRMDPAHTQIDASFVVNNSSEKELADIFFNLGDETL
jgi:16S rRNA (cytosine1402-N4)-methyltransferase